MDWEKSLIEKAIESFVLGIEIYNKPTIKYRVEGFSFFICNAWELMLKAHLIKTNGFSSIFYKDNTKKTISLENCIKLVFTNSKDPLRKNLETIVKLRNTSTHFVVEEYEMLYIPLFQACVFNFNDKMSTFHEVDMTSVIPQNFLSLSVSMKAINTQEIKAKYPEEIANGILSQKDTIDNLSEMNNSNFAIKIIHNHFITKNKEEATSFVAIDNSNENTVKVKIIKQMIDPNNTHIYTAKRGIRKINEKLRKSGIILKYNQKDVEFNMHHFTNLTEYFKIKENESFCYIYKPNSTPSYTYSQQAIDFIFGELEKDSENILNKIKINKN